MGGCNHTPKNKGDQEFVKWSKVRPSLQQDLAECTTEIIDTATAKLNSGHKVRHQKKLSGIGKPFLKKVCIFLQERGVGLAEFKISLAEKSEIFSPRGVGRSCPI